MKYFPQSIRSLLLPCALLLLLATGIYGGRFLLVEMTVHSIAIPLLERKLPGLKLSVQSVHSDLISTIALTDTTIRFEHHDGSRFQARIPRLELHYSLADLKTSFNTLIANAHLGITLADAHLDIAPSPSEIAPKASPSLTITIPALPFPLPEIKLTYDTLTVSHPALQAAAYSGEISIAPWNGGAKTPSIPIQLSAGRCEISVANSTRAVQQVSAKATYKPGAITLDIATANNPGLLHDLTLEDHSGILSAQATLESGGGALTLQAEIANEVKINFRTTKINLKEMTLPIPSPGIPQSGTVVAKGHLAFPVSEPHKVTGEVQLAVEHLSFSSLPIDTLTLNANADNGLLHIRTLMAKSNDNSLALKEFTLDVPKMIAQEWQALAELSSGTFELAIGHLEALSPLLPERLIKTVKQYGIDQLHIQGQYENGVFELPMLTVHSTNNSIKAHHVRADLNPWITQHEWPAVPLSAEVKIQTNGADFLQEFRQSPPVIKGSFQGTMQMDGTLGAPLISFQASGKRGAYNTLPFETMTTQGSYQTHNFSMDQITLTNEHDTITGNLQYLADVAPSFGGALDFHIAEIDSYLTKELRQRYPIKGDLSGTLTMGDAGNSGAGELTVHANTLRYAETQVEQLTGSASLSGNDLTINSVQAVLPEQDVMLQGAGILTCISHWDQFLLQLNQFSLTSKGQTLALQRPTKLTYKSGQTTTNSPIILLSEPGIISLSGSLSSASVDLDISGKISNGEKFMAPFAPSPFSFQDGSFTLGISGSPNTPQLRFTGRIAHIQSGDAPPLDGIFSLSLADKVLHIEQFTVSDTLSPRMTLRGQLPLSLTNYHLSLKEGPLQLSGTFDLQSSPLLPWLLTDTLERIGTVQGNINLRGTWQDPVGQIHISTTDLLLRNIPDWLPPAPLSATLDISADKGLLSVRNASIDSQIATLQMQGTVSNKNPLQAIGQLDKKELLANTALDLQGSINFKEISWLAERYEMLRRTTGEVNSDFKLSGTPEHPDITATLSVKDGAVRLSSDLPTLRDVALQARLASNIFVINHFSGTLGGAPVQGEGQVILPDGSTPLSLDLSLSGTDLLLYRADGLRFRGQAALKINGAANQPHLGGEIILTDAKITRNIDFLSSLLSGLSAKETPAPHFPSITSPPLRDTLFTLKLSANSPIPFSNNMMKGSLTPHLELHGTGEVPFLSGNISVNEATVTLPTGKINISSGLIQFLPTDPDRPLLELSGEAKMLGYDISINISGPYNAPVILLSSTPALPNEDLLLLLLTGKRPASENSQPNQVQNYSSVMVYFGKNLMNSLRSTDESAPDDNVLDRLQLEIGKNITQQGEETIEARFLLMENIKSGRNAVLLTGEKDAWDKYNGGLRLVFKFQ